MALFRQFSLAVLLTTLGVNAALAADTIVVCPAAFREAIGPWVKYRTAQGHEILVLPATNSPTQISHSIREVAASHNIKAILLVGDARFGNRVDATSVTAVPVHYVRSRVIPDYGGEDYIATDNPYGDLDGDGLPDVAVGRLPADSPEDLAAMIRKIVTYESNPDFGTWRRQVNLVAGVGGFGPLLDGVIETTTKMFLTSGVSASFQTTMTQASWTSPYCPDPRRFCATTIGRLNEGCLFWVYMGHGEPQSLDHLNVPGHRFPIMTSADVPGVRCQPQSPIALFFCCYAGAFDAGEDCLAEELVRSPQGPVAAVAGSRVTMPYAMAILGSGMLTEFFQNHRPTLGEVFLHAKRRLAGDGGRDTRRVMLDSLAGLMNGGQHDLADERAEHLHLFNLLGDPLLRFRYPQAIEITSPKEAEAGSEIVVSATAPIDGRATVELIVRRDRLTFTPPPRLKYDESEEGRAAFNDVYSRANDLRLASVELQTTDRQFNAVLQVPKNASGPCHVRVFVQGATNFAAGARDILIRSRQESLASDPSESTVR